MGNDEKHFIFQMRILIIKKKYRLITETLTFLKEHTV